MKKFSIYKPYTFYWTRTYKSYAFIVASIGLVLILKFIVKVPESHQVFKALFFLPLLPFVYSVVRSVLVTNKYKPLKGELDGYIIFKNDVVIIAQQTYALDTIQEIKFEGVDWIGYENWTRGLTEYFEDPCSQGVDNYLTLHLIDGQVIKTRFQKQDEFEFREIEELILGYYLQDKISYLQTVQVLCLSSQEEWNNLKELKCK